ncbi:hypothetical protein SHLO109777_02980 [Shewanella loihica]|uniref:Uncharacterized protein n=1 Tax=Shewanella loihica (strain ATCC BAA-1088 / PV-4) TaxID=323850 RepID=A3QDL1_SHELP|nr:hypothetical protein [Shewanella loihica]ABO23559.1 hypothetical protein Shew_1692 [Shewanella loihica PV-4]
MEFWNEFKNSVAVALLFLLLGFIGGVGAYKYLSDFFNADVVLKGSYVYKTDIEKQFISAELYEKALKRIEGLETKNADLKSNNDSLRASVSEFSRSICQRYASEANSIIDEQREVEDSIQNALSLFISYSKKDEERLAADKEKAIELRKYSAQLNEQLIQVREKISKCVK